LPPGNLAAFDSLLCLDDVERAAAAVLPPPVWDFLSGGSGRELTLAANRGAFDDIFVTPRVLRDVSSCSTDTMLLGHAASMPVAIAPMAFHRLFHPDGELATARAAKTAGVPFTVSTLSSVPIEEVTAIGGSVWFQLYWLREHRRTLELARRAEDAGCCALVLTVDIPWMGRRLHDMRNQFTLPDDVFAAHLEAAPSSAHRQALNASALAIHAAQVFAPSVTWACVEALRESTTLPLVLKGVMAPEDASRAAEFGVDAIVVSNHGGRQLDGALPSIAALAQAVEAAGSGCSVLLDGGVRTGSDLLKALALGAAGVLVGRPLMWGLAVAGDAGALRVLDLLAAELGDALGLAGCDDVSAAQQLRTFHRHPDERHYHPVDRRPTR